MIKHRTSDYADFACFMRVTVFNVLLWFWSTDERDGILRKPLVECGFLVIF